MSIILYIFIKFLETYRLTYESKTLNRVFSWVKYLLL